MEDTLREGVQTLTSDYIPALTEFVPEVAEAATSGLGKIASALSPLITTVLKNPKGVAAAFTSIGAGLAAFKTAGLAKDMLTTVDGTSKLTSTLTNLGDVLTENWWAAGAALVTTSVAAIGFAIDQYNDMQIEENLNSHFGDISLDTSQIEVLAGQIVDVDFTADMHVADVWFNEAEQLVSQGEQLLAENDFLWWQINNVGLTTGAGDEIISNSEEFQKTITDAIEKDVYPATLTVEALLGDADAGPIVEQMQQWAREDTETVEAMGSAVSELLGRAFEEGADTADIEAAVQILQKKMLDIVNGLNESSLEGELKWLQFSTEGAALDEESWSGVVEKAVELQQEQESLVESEYQNTFSLLEQFAHNDESRRGTVDVMEQVLAESFSDYKQNTATGVWEKIYTSLGGIYGEELDTLQNAMESSSFKGKIEGVDFQSGLVFAQTDLEYAIQEQFKELDPGTQEILADRYESMLPTVQQMDDIISKAAEQGESVPQSMMEAYSEAMELGAAAGDTEAMWQYMANEVAQDFPSKEDFVSTLEANGMNFSDWPEEIQKCFEKAFVDTDSTVDYSSMLKNFAEAMSEDDIDWSNVESLLNEFGYSIKGALEEQGVTIEDTDIPVHADGINVDMDELGRSLEGLNYVGSTETDAGELVLKYTVDEGETLSGIMQQYGVVWSEVEEQIKEANPEIADLNMIYPDQIIKIPKAILELADIDTSGVGKAVDEAVSEATESVEAEGASTEIGIAANTTITAGENDMTAVETSVQSDLDNMDTWETDGDTQVTLEQENNADEVYSAIGTRLKTLFETPYNIPASANVSIDVDYSIANPTATISIGGSGTGTGMVTASIIGHAAGGYFDTPHLAWIAEGGAGEWIIPDDGSDRSRQMWNAAGETLGMFEGISQMPQSAYATIPESGAVGEMAASGVVERKITVELKGIGKLNISREMSKEQVADILSDNLKETLMNILQQEILEEGIGSYDY
jgi:LysM repeat protein